MRPLLFAVLFCGLPTVLLSAVDFSQPHRTTATGYVTDASHPNHPGDFRRYDLTLAISTIPERGEADIEVSWEENGKRQADHYFFRRGRVFQVSDSAKEKPADPLGDISPATIVALFPELVEMALLERRSAATDLSSEQALFAWNDQLWTIRRAPGGGWIYEVSRQTYSDLYGDGSEEIRFVRMEGIKEVCDTVIVTQNGRETARFAFGAVTLDSARTIPEGDPSRNHAVSISGDEVSFKEIAPHLYTIDLVAQNTRVMVAEFADYLMVIEGAYSSRICDRLSELIGARFGKPVNYFAFSHLHGQYVGGVRSWIHAEATVLVPLSTKPMIEQIAQSTHSFYPDNLAREPKALTVETIGNFRAVGDDLNTVEIHNVVSDHTDDYFIFYFPHQKLLLTGDLLFYRPGKKLSGRSKKLCETVAGLGLDVELYCATWPLDGYGTKNVVTREEMSAACGK